MSSLRSNDFSLVSFFSTPLFSLARRDRYGKTSLTGPYGKYLYAEYPAWPVAENTTWWISKKITYFAYKMRSTLLNDLWKYQVVRSDFRNFKILIFSFLQIKNIIKIKKKNFKLNTISSQSPLCFEVSHFMIGTIL